KLFLGDIEMVTRSSVYDPVISGYHPIKTRYITSFYVLVTKPVRAQTSGRLLEIPANRRRPAQGQLQP
ncbi:MAG: hypothetical protein AN484_26170, partial [Aphanizomenon flos-aquae WA102]